MAMYLNPHVMRRNRGAEIGIDLRFIQGPPLTSWPWSGVVLYYLAVQLSFYASDGVTNQGGGHVGLQIYDNADLGDAPRTIVNWGCYDNTIGLPYSVFRSSNPIEPNQFIDVNIEVSFGWRWDYGDWIRFRVFKSPKQDWTANEIKPGTNQVPPYVDTDQQPDEVAYRCTLENLTKGRVPIAFHDVLVKSPHPDTPINFDSAWVEPIGDPDLYTKWYYSPIAQLRHLELDGRSAIHDLILNYGTGDYGPAINCDITSVAGTPGYYQLEGRDANLGGMVQTTPDGTISTPPSGFYDTAPASVASDIHDLAARVPTPRPWY